MIRTPRIKFAILAADTVFFVFDGRNLLVRLIQIKRPPHYNASHWGLPGGLLLSNETAHTAALRHLHAKGNIKGGHLEQLFTFSRIDRDPRGRVVAVAYLGLGFPDNLKFNEGEQEFRAQWFSVTKLPHLAYDHKEIIKVARERLQAKFGYTTIARELLPKEFTLSELQLLYERVLGRKLDKRNFRKKIIALKLVVPSGGERRGTPNRPAQCWKFVKRTPDIIDIL